MVRSSAVLGSGHEGTGSNEQQEVTSDPPNPPKVEDLCFLKKLNGSQKKPYLLRVSFIGPAISEKGPLYQFNQVTQDK